MITKINPAKRFIRKVVLMDFMENKSLKMLIKSIYLLLNSPYFHYTVYSIFLKKEK